MPDPFIRRQRRLSSGGFASSYGGVTVIECLVSLMIGLVILSLLYGLIRTASHHAFQQETFAEASELRLRVNQLLQRSIRLAGFAGCAMPAGWSPPFGQKAASETLAFWRASASNAVLVHQQRSSRVLYVSEELRFRPNDTILVTDCLFTERAKIRQVILQDRKIQKLILLAPLLHHFAKNAEVFLYGEEKYFIDQKARGGTLYWQDLHGEKRELAQGIQHMQIQYQRYGGKVRGVSIRFEGETRKGRSIWYLYAAPRNI